MRALWIVAIAHAGCGCAKPERGARVTPDETSRRRSTLIGVATGGRGGPAVLVDGRRVYVMGLDAWPEDWIGQQVVVTGRIETRRGLPADATMGGIVGPYRVIRFASWHLAPYPALVFEYSASDGEFAYRFELFDDRTWQRSEHSGTANPQGRLSRRAMKRFVALLRAAPFVLVPRECVDDARLWAENPEAPIPRHWARFTDGLQNRSVDTEPCFAADETTHRLLHCVETLAARGDAENACAFAAQATSATSAPQRE